MRAWGLQPHVVFCRSLDLFVESSVTWCFQVGQLNRSPSWRFDSGCFSSFWFAGQQCLEVFYLERTRPWIRFVLPTRRGSITASVTAVLNWSSHSIFVPVGLIQAPLSSEELTVLGYTSGKSSVQNNIRCESDSRDNNDFKAQMEISVWNFTHILQLGS